jgi:hypothetical protein
MDCNLYSQYIYMGQKTQKVNPISFIGEFPSSLEIYRIISAYEFIHITYLLFFSKFTISPYY